MDAATLIYIVNLIISLSTTVTFVFVLKWHRTGLHILPKGLRLYLRFCCFPFAAVINVGSIYCCVYYLIFHTESHFSFEKLKFIVAFASQQVRNSFFTIGVERIIATVYFQTYNSSSKLSLFYSLTLYSYASSTLYLIYLVLSFSIPNWIFLYFPSHLFVFGFHLISLVMCSVLHMTNKKMYKLSAYQIPLEQRHQIFENIKVLSFIFVPTLIFTTIAPIGSALTILLTIFYNYVAPFGLFHLAYNLSFLIILIWCLISNRPNEDANQSQIHTATTVINPFGKSLPANVTSDSYFKTLKQEWA